MTKKLESSPCLLPFLELFAQHGKRRRCGKEIA